LLGIARCREAAGSGAGERRVATNNNASTNCAKKHPVGGDIVHGKEHRQHRSPRFEEKPPGRSAAGQKRPFTVTSPMAGRISSRSRIWPALKTITRKFRSP
jgi:hypothetical protein